MAISTYTELKSAVGNWIDRTTLENTLVPDFIALAEVKINRALRIQEMENEADITITNGAATLPTGFRAARRLYLVGDPNVDLKYIPTHRWNEGNLGSSSASNPRFYTYSRGTMDFKPAGGGTAKLLYYKSFDTLTDVIPTTTLLTEHPDVYLYGAVAEGFSYLMDDQQATKYFGLFAATLKAIQTEDDKSRISGSALRPRAISSTP